MMALFHRQLVICGFLVANSLAFVGNSRSGLKERGRLSGIEAEKRITFTNYKEKKRPWEHEQTWTFKNDQDFHHFLVSVHAHGAEDSLGNKYRQLALMNESIKYNLSYSAEISEDGADYTPVEFEAKAKLNSDVVNELIRLGHKDVRQTYSFKKVFFGGTEDVMLDCIIETSKNFCVVKSKLHAKMDDIHILQKNLAILIDPRYNLVHHSDPRKNNAVGIIVTLSATSELQIAARLYGQKIWIYDDENGLNLYPDSRLLEPDDQAAWRG